MFIIEAPYWRRRRLCRGIARRFLGLGDVQPDENEGPGQFRLKVRRTLSALQVNSWFLTHMESHGSPECYEKEERRLVSFTKKMYNKWKTLFPLLTKLVPTTGTWERLAYKGYWTSSTSYRAQRHQEESTYGY